PCRTRYRCGGRCAVSPPAVGRLLGLPDGRGRTQSRPRTARDVRPRSRQSWCATAVTWDLDGATIAYRGVEKRLNQSLASGPIRFVSIRHTELATGEAFSVRRHFVEIFKWIPLREARTWTLSWTLVEVVRDTLVSL